MFQLNYSLIGTRSLACLPTRLCLSLCMWWRECWVCPNLARGLGSGYGFGAGVDSHETNCTPPLRLTQMLWNSKSTVLSLPFTVTS